MPRGQRTARIVKMLLVLAKRMHLLLFVPMVFGDMVFGRETVSNSGNSIEKRATLNQNLPVTYGGTASIGQYHRWFKSKFNINLFLQQKFEKKNFV